MGEPGYSRLTTAAQQAILEGARLAVELQECSERAEDPALAALCAMMAEYLATQGTLAHIVLEEVEPMLCEMKTMRKEMSRIRLALRLPDDEPLPWWRWW